jgi:hypothetical protein
LFVVKTPLNTGNTSEWAISTGLKMNCYDPS